MPLSPIQEVPSMSSGRAGSANKRSSKRSGSQADDILALLGGSTECEEDDVESSHPDHEPNASAPPTSAVLRRNHNSKSNASTDGKKVRFSGGNPESHRRAPTIQRNQSSNGGARGGSGVSQPEEARAQEQPVYTESGLPLTLSQSHATSHHPHHQYQRPSAAISSIFSNNGNRQTTLLQEDIDSNGSTSNHGIDTTSNDQGYTAHGRRGGHTAATNDHVIERLKRRHQDEIDAINAKHEEELDHIKKENTIQAQKGSVDSGLVKDAVAVLQSVASDLKSQLQKERDDLGAKQSRLDSLQVSLQKERERLMDVHDDERTKLMSRLESLETKRLEHAQCHRKQQSELQKARDELERGKLEFAIRVQDIEEKLERKRESLAQDKQFLIDSKEKLAQERADFEESRRMARTELQGADALRRELAEVQNNINAEATRLSALKEQLEYETKSLLEQEKSIAARLVEAEKLEAKNIQTLKDIEARNAEHDRVSARLQEREERLLYSSIDAMKSRYHIQQQQHHQQQQAPNGMSSVATQQYYSSDYGGHRLPFMYPPLSPTNMNERK